MTTTLSKRDTLRYGDLVARAVRISNAAGVMDFNGHVSQRDEDDANIFWINNRHASRSALTAADIVAFDITAAQRIGEGIEPPSEWPIHAEIYRRRPDVKGIVHCHPDVIVSLSASGVRIKPTSIIGGFLPETGAPVFKTPLLINTPQRGRAVAEALGDAAMVVLRQHGAVTVGDGAKQAVVRMICAEMNAKQQYQALQVGEPTYFQGEELRNVASEVGGAHSTKKYWHYHEELARRLGALSGLE